MNSEAAYTCKRCPASFRKPSETNHTVIVHDPETGPRFEEWVTPICPACFSEHINPPERIAA